MNFVKGSPYCKQCLVKYMVREEPNRVMLRCKCGCLFLYKMGDFTYIPKAEFNEELAEQKFEEKENAYYRTVVKDYREAVSNATSKAKFQEL